MRQRALMRRATNMVNDDNMVNDGNAVPVGSNDIAIQRAVRRSQSRA